MTRMTVMERLTGEARQSFSTETAESVESGKGKGKGNSEVESRKQGKAGSRLYCGKDSCIHDRF
jgi:hypothetical protein